MKNSLCVTLVTLVALLLAGCCNIPAPDRKVEREHARIIDEAKRQPFPTSIAREAAATDPK